MRRCMECREDIGVNETYAIRRVDFMRGEYGGELRHIRCAPPDVRNVITNVPLRSLPQPETSWPRRLWRRLWRIR